MAVTLHIEVPSRVHVGEAFRMVVVASTPEPRACTSLVFTLRGTATIAREDVEICAQRASEQPEKLAAGDTRFEISFTIPPDAPPTFRHAYGAASYVVSAVADLPWSRDVEAHAEVRVELPEATDVGAEKVKERGRRRGATDDKSPPTAIVELARDVSIGGILQGTLQLRHGSGACRAIHAWIQGLDQEGDRVEESEHEPVVAPESLAYGAPFPKVAGPFGRGTFPLALAVPARSARDGGGHGPSFTAKVASLRHQVVVRMEGGSWDGIRVTLPLRIHAPTSATHEVAARAREERHRRARVTAWAAAKATVDLTDTEVTENEGASVFELVRGAARTQIAAERRSAEGPRLRASLRWPSLGVGLRVASTAEAEFEGFEIDRDLADRCAIGARTETQARALVSDVLARTLAAFDRVDLHDRGGGVESPGSLHARQDVTTFLKRCVALQRSIRVRRRKIPLLASIAAYEAAFAAFAARRRAALAPGDLAVDVVERGGIGWSLRFRFAAEMPVGLDVVSDNDTGLDLVADAADQARARLGHGVERVGRNLRMSLPLAADPAGVESLIDAFVDLTRTLVRGGQRGPYR